MTLELPTQMTPPSLNPDTAKVLLYGPPKIGKTTLAATVDPEHTLLLATEAGYGALEAFVQPITSWNQFRQVGPALLENEHQFKTLVIDTVDELYKFCTEQVMLDLGVKHPADLEYGRGWGAVSDEFRLRVGALCALGLGVWFISHSKEEEVKARVGSITVTSPTLTGGGRKFLLGFVDFILLARSEVHEDGERRVLRTAATENFEAGGRVTLPDPLPLEAGALREAMLAAAPKLPELVAEKADAQPELAAA